MLGLAYFWNGSEYGIQPRRWARWIIYSILVDLTDDIAQLLGKRFIDLSIERVFKSLYYFREAHREAKPSDPISYLAENARFFNLIKAQRWSARDRVWLWVIREFPELLNL